MLDKLHKHFGDMIVNKKPQQTEVFKNLSLPSFMRDWLVMRYSDENGDLDMQAVTEFINEKIPRREQWEQLKHKLNCGERVIFLTKVRVEVDTNSGETLFSMPDFGFPTKKRDAVINQKVVNENTKQLLSDNDAWGVVELTRYEDEKGRGIVEMVGFKPFCPYEADFEYYRQAREKFTIEEWIDIVIAAVDYNPAGYVHEIEKMTLLSRLLPFVEKRVNVIELAPKGTGKSYLFAQISKYGWLISGGSVSRARLFYDIAKNQPGLIKNYDYVALDEIQSINFTNPEEIQGALKNYLESGEAGIGKNKIVGEAGFVLLGNIDEGQMNVNLNMFNQLPLIFRESALIDRFHGFITGWEIPRLRENLKAQGWALNVEYFTEILHFLRHEPSFDGIVNQLLVVPKDADVRDTRAIKRLCCAWLKLLFPHAANANDISVDEFDRYCLQPAINMRGIIRKQLSIIDPGEYSEILPDIKVKRDVA